MIAEISLFVIAIAILLIAITKYKHLLLPPGTIIMYPYKHQSGSWMKVIDRSKNLTVIRDYSQYNQIIIDRDFSSNKIVIIDTPELLRLNKNILERKV